VLIYEGKEKSITGGEKLTTNNRMELSAIINALKILKEKCSVEVFTDSKYAQLGMTDWIGGWIKNNWKNSKKKEIENVDLWKELYAISQNHEIKWSWVKAHNGNKYNEIVDKLANEEAKKFQ
jgi:ribonuclease HI